MGRWAVNSKMPFFELENDIFECGFLHLQGRGMLSNVKNEGKNVKTGFTFFKGFWAVFYIFRVGFSIIIGKVDTRTHIDFLSNIVTYLTGVICLCGL